MTRIAGQLDLGAARPLSIATADGPIAALHSGPPDGRPALLLPGYTGSKEDFGPIMDALAGAGLHAVAIDLPGQYESPGPTEVAGYTTVALGSRVREIAAQLGDGVHLVGHSFGGLVARAAVLAGADLFASLVLMDSGPAALSGSRAERIELMRPLLPELGVAGIYAASEAPIPGVSGAKLADAIRAVGRPTVTFIEQKDQLVEAVHPQLKAGDLVLTLGAGDIWKTGPALLAKLTPVP